jgi:hypothetical protein
MITIDYFSVIGFMTIFVFILGIPEYCRFTRHVIKTNKLE